MKNAKIIGWASLLFLIIFSSCRENTFEPDVTITIPEPIVNVISSVQGRVVDADQNGIAGATIEMGSLTIATDEYGYFRFLDKQMNKNGTLITATQNGYFLGAKMFDPSLGETSILKFQLIEKVLTGSFTATAGGTITTTDNASISFGANGVMYENGAAYNGEVRVFAKWLNPDVNATFDEMPGDLRALNTESEIVQLATFGMMAVELETPSGQALQVAEGTKATLSFPIADSQKSTAPSSIPLWSFDEDNGHWIEESSATIVNGAYVGEVSHFSFWNCDAPFPIVYVNGSVKYTNGLPATGYNVQITIVSNPAVTRAGLTSNQGKYGGKMPKDELLDITISDNCDVIVYNAQIGPFSTETTVGDILVDGSNIVLLSGILEKCAGTAVTEGYAIINGEGNQAISYVDAMGAFEAAINLCEDGTLTITGYDIEDLFTADPVTVDASAAGGALDLGTISLCDQIDEYLEVLIDEIDYDYLVVDLEINEAQGTFNINNSGGGQDSTSFYINAEAVTGPGTYTITNFNYADYNFTENGNDWGLYLGCLPVGCPELVISVYEGSGGYVEGTISGLVQAQENPTFDEFDIEITFRKKLD